MPIFRKEPYRNWDSPISEIDRFLEEDAIRRHKGGTRREEKRPLVRMNAFKMEHYVVVHPVLPDIRSEDLNVNISGNALSIEGWFKPEEEQKQQKIHLQERQYEEFHRAITLPANLDKEASEALLEDGFLNKIPNKRNRNRKKSLSFDHKVLL